MTHTDNPNAAPEFNVGDVVCISAKGRHQNMTGRIVEVQPNGACEVHIPRTDANGLASDVRIWHSASHLTSGNAADLKPAPTPDIFTRLKDRGLHYPDIIIALSYYSPQYTLMFSQWFKGRTINQVFQQFEKWDELLRKDFVLALGGELKPKDQQRLRSQVLRQLEKWDKFLVRDFVLAQNVKLKSKVQQWLQGQFRKLEKWDELLGKNFVLALDVEVKSEVQQYLGGIGTCVAKALIEANPTVDPWDLKLLTLPTAIEKGEHFTSVIFRRCDGQGATTNEEDRQLIHVNPNPVQIVATHRETKEEKTAPVIGAGGLFIGIFACKEAFEQLGLWDPLWKGNPGPSFVSQRATQGWPFFTRVVIPQLYDLLAPHYELPGHHWARHGDAGSPRLAEYPQELLADMLEILRLEYEFAFKETTMRQLTAAVQKHIARKKSK